MKTTSTQKYYSLIEKARSENRVKGQGIYYEGHHIVPKCVGGKGSSNGWKTHPNIILLTAKEHLQAHIWLVDMYPDHKKSLSWAVHRMLNSKNNLTPRDLDLSMEEYEDLRMKHAKFVSQSQTGRKLKPETAEKISQRVKERGISGEKNPFYGKTHTPEMIEFFRTSQQGEKSAMYGKKRDRDAVERGAEKLRGVPKSKEHREKLSQAKKGIPNIELRKYTQEQEIEISNMKEKEAREKYNITRSTFYRIKKRNNKIVVDLS